MLRFVPPDHRLAATAEPAARPDSAALLQRLAQGDAQALSQLYRLEAGAVYRYALGLCGNAGWAADATQDAFVALATRPTACDLRRGSPGAWLAGVARHVLLALWQRTRHETPWLELAGDDGDALPSADVAAAHSPETLMVRAQQGETVWAAVRRLPFAQREAVLLVDLQERSYEEAARIAGIELNTLRTRLHRGRARLAQWLQGDG
jgi:RNA polymerase sigma factor (sigma-70 family)